MPTLKGTEVSLFYVQCFLYLVSSSINISIFHITWLDTFWTDLVHHPNYRCCRNSKERGTNEDWSGRESFLDKKDMNFILKDFGGHYRSWTDIGKGQE